MGKYDGITQTRSKGLAVPCICGHRRCAGAVGNCNKGQQPAPTVPRSLACLNPQPTNPAQPPVVCRGGGTILYRAGWNLVAGYEGRGAGTYITGASAPLYTLRAGDTNY